MPDSLAVAGCRSSDPDNEAAAALAAQQAAAATTAAPAAVAVAATGNNLASFDLVKGAGQMVGTFAKTAAGSWTGPYPTTGQTVTWSARSDDLSLVLYTESPQITTIVLYTDTTDISSSAMDPAENFQATNLRYQ